MAVSAGGDEVPAVSVIRYLSTILPPPPPPPPPFPESPALPPGCAESIAPAPAPPAALYGPLAPPPAAAVSRNPPGVPAAPSPFWPAPAPPPPPLAARMPLLRMTGDCR